MTEEDNYTDIDISDVIDDSEQFIEHEKPCSGSELQESEPFNIVQESEYTNTENIQTAVTETKRSKTEVVRSTRLPIGRIKAIMKMDPDVNIINTDAAFLVTKATELFLETIAKETYTYTASKKRKTIAKKDLDNIINMVDCLCFLEGAMDF
ncbi:DNA polymerase epsilon subunit 4 [Eumeta japonica]|uniref:DNA polymerase epsilon subunit 4 n=1 Tax=Eumeta variegata TaxID=151549 RepID=A0A4C1UMB0_EUMVA|nr:DNA polymerase epsilon subunit 4 [Eumeta japonica]